MSPSKNLPGAATPAKTVIIGATGRMGAMLCARSRAAGLTVAGADQPLTPEILAPACAGANLALICVPAAVFEDVLLRVRPHLPSNTVLADITSVKEHPCLLYTSPSPRDS